MRQQPPFAEDPKAWVTGKIMGAMFDHIGSGHTATTTMMDAETLHTFNHQETRMHVRQENHKKMLTRIVGSHGGLQRNILIPTNHPVTVRY